MSTAIMPELLLPSDAAGILYLTQRKLLALARAGGIDHILIDGQIYFTAEDLAAFIRARRIVAKREDARA